MNENEINILFMCFIACFSALVGLSAWCYEMYKYQNKLLDSLENLKNFEGNKLIPTTQLRSEVSGLKYSLLFKWIIPLGVVGGVILKIYFP